MTGDGVMRMGISQFGSIWVKRGLKKEATPPALPTQAMPSGSCPVESNGCADKEKSQRDESDDLANQPQCKALRTLAMHTPTQLNKATLLPSKTDAFLVTFGITGMDPSLDQFCRKALLPTTTFQFIHPMPSAASAHFSLPQRLAGGYVPLTALLDWAIFALPCFPLRKT